MFNRTKIFEDNLKKRLNYNGVCGEYVCEKRKDTPAFRTLRKLFESISFNDSVAERPILALKGGIVPEGQTWSIDFLALEHELNDKEKLNDPTYLIKKLADDLAHKVSKERFIQGCHIVHNDYNSAVLNEIRTRLNKLCDEFCERNVDK